MSTKTVTLDPRIYKISAVKATIEDYSDVSDIKMKKDNGNVIVTFENWPEEYNDTIEFEFCNYVLWKTRN